MLGGSFLAGTSVPSAAALHVDTHIYLHIILISLRVHDDTGVSINRCVRMHASSRRRWSSSRARRSAGASFLAVVAAVHVDTYVHVTYLHIAALTHTMQFDHRFLHFRIVPLQIRVQACVYTKMRVDVLASCGRRWSSSQARRSAAASSSPARHTVAWPPTTAWPGPPAPPPPSPPPPSGFAASRALLSPPPPPPPPSPPA